MNKSIILSMKKWTALSLLAATTLSVAGCDEGEDVGADGKPAPALGSYVYVQFRRDYLGLASDKPTTPMGEGMNMSLASSGELMKLTDEFLVLQVDNEPGRELWIPRDAILLLDVRKTK